MISGITLAMINPAIRSDAIGSNIGKPVYLISTVEMMTPTLPKKRRMDKYLGLYQSVHYAMPTHGVLKKD
jgi:hypothetical protein